MPTASYVKYTAAIEPLLEGINAGTDTWNIALALTVNAADTTFTAGTTDLATAGLDRIWRWIYVSICDTLGCNDQHPGSVLGLRVQRNRGLRRHHYRHS